MSKMRSSFLKPPLPKSPLRLRSRQVTSPDSVTRGTKVPYDYSTISNEIHALAKMVTDEFSEEEARRKAMNLETLAAKSVPVFERGRFYEEYSAKRNERLRRKKGGEEGVGVTPYKLGVKKCEVMSNKRRGGSVSGVKKFESVKKSVEVVTTGIPRYSLRSMTKENRKPPVVPVNVAVSAMKCVTSTTRRGRRI